MADGYAQLAPGYYYIAFTDKANTPYTTTNPQAFLSQKAINRRQSQQIDITEEDLPVDPAYVQQVEQAGNVRIHHALKWMNGVVIETYDTVALDAIDQLNFVDTASSVLIRPDSSGKWAGAQFHKDKFNTKALSGAAVSSGDSVYGGAQAQIEQINIHYLHEEGHTGAGMLIAVMDAGFSGMDTLEAYASLMASGRVKATYDFVRRDSLLTYRASTHGTYVMGCMAAKDTGVVIGTAPDADYLLLRTENVFSEYILEEYHWAAAAEFADSAGAYVFNTSLGYTTFDDPRQNHEYPDLDGNSTVITRAANTAATKGILVVNSAGNYGNAQWRYIGAPADGDGVLAVGAVDVGGNLAGFSSRGPNAAGMVKPNVMANGVFAATPGYFQPIEYVNGTSFSGPIIAGAAACLWQANSNRTALEIKQAIEESAHLFNNPNDDFGYGIPHFPAADWNFTGTEEEVFNTNELLVYPNPANRVINVSEIAQGESIQIFDLAGKLWIKTRNASIDVSMLQPGVYIVKADSKTSKLVIQR